MPILSYFYANIAIFSFWKYAINESERFIDKIEKTVESLPDKIIKEGLNRVATVLMAYPSAWEKCF